MYYEINVKESVQTICQSRHQFSLVGGDKLLRHDYNQWVLVKTSSIYDDTVELTLLPSTAVNISSLQKSASSSIVSFFYNKVNHHSAAAASRQTGHCVVYRLKFTDYYVTRQSSLISMCWKANTATHQWDADLSFLNPGHQLKELRYWQHAPRKPLNRLISRHLHTTATV